METELVCCDSCPAEGSPDAYTDCGFHGPEGDFHECFICPACWAEYERRGLDELYKAG